MKNKNLQDKILLFFFYSIVTIFSLICLAPLYIALVSSLSSETSLLKDGYGLLINDFSLTAYKLIFSGTNTVLNAYAVTTFTTVMGVFLTLILTSSFSYPLAVTTLKYRNTISLVAYITMIFSGGLVPSYILTTQFLHLHNNLLVLIIPGSLSAGNVFFMKNYFKSIPKALSESAKIDGASEIYIYFKIILPLAKPILATIALFASMQYWNSWYNVLLYIDDRNLYTLQYLIMQLQQQVDFLTSNLNPHALASMGSMVVPAIGIRLATAMVSIGPIIILYPFLQKHFIKGLTIGAVKG